MNELRLAFEDAALIFAERTAEERKVARYVLLPFPAFSCDSAGDTGQVRAPTAENGGSRRLDQPGEGKMTLARHAEGQACLALPLPYTPRACVSRGSSRLVRV